MIYEWLEFISIHTFNIKSDVYEAVLNPEESFRERLFYVQITPNVLIYLQSFMTEAHCDIYFTNKGPHKK